MEIKRLRHYWNCRSLKLPGFKRIPITRQFHGNTKRSSAGGGGGGGGGGPEWTNGLDWMEWNGSSRCSPLAIQFAAFHFIATMTLLIFNVAPCCVCTAKMNGNRANHIFQTIFDTDGLFFSGIYNFHILELPSNRNRKIPSRSCDKYYIRIYLPLANCPIPPISYNYWK